MLELNMDFLLLLGGLSFLLIGGEALVRGSVAIGNQLEMSPLLVGMVIVGFGTSMPELVVSVRAVIDGAAGLAVGNVIGSNISNILLILGCAAMLAPITRPERALVPDGIVLVAISCAVVALGWFGNVSALQGSVYLLVLIGLICAEYFRAKREARLRKIIEEPVPMPDEVPQRPMVSLLLACSGIAGLVFGADLLVSGATEIAKAMGVSPGLIGLTIVAVGTSLPELASSMVAAWRGHKTVAYGNVIGSNLFNLLGILGASALAGPLTFPFVMVWLDGPIMILATVVMVYFVSSGTGLTRSEATVLLLSYISYIVLRYAYAVS